jgi:transcriptional regulator with XRE-family HTH domain
MPGTTARQTALWSLWGHRIARARLAAGYTQASLAAALGLKKGTVSFWEIGRRAPSLAHRREICKLLGVKPTALQCQHDHCPTCGKPWR